MSQFFLDCCDGGERQKNRFTIVDILVHKFTNLKTFIEYVPIFLDCRDGGERQKNRFTIVDILVYKFTTLKTFIECVPIFLDRRDGGERQRRKMTAQGEAVSLIVQNLRPGKKEQARSW